MKMVVDVKLVSRFKFKDENSGKELEGTKVFYEGELVDNDTKRGVEAVQMNSEKFEAFNDFPKVPSKYEIDFNLVPGKQGQVKMQYVSAKLVDKQ